LDLLGIKADLVMRDALKLGIGSRILLKGGMGQKQRKETMTQLVAIPPDVERVIMVTGRYIGEGFDDSRLDTFFLTMPISWKGTLQQYAGRLHREYVFKKEVLIYDYISADTADGQMERKKLILSIRTEHKGKRRLLEMSFGDQMSVTGKTPGKIFELLATTPTLTIPELASLRGKLDSAVERAIRKLRESGRLKRIGPDKGGYWEVIDD
jgi:superfamily II DNA or RNA helicase